MKNSMLEYWPHNWYGVWRRGKLFPDCPLVEDCIGQPPLPDTAEILDYLDKSPVISAFAMLDKCLLCDNLLPVGIHSDCVFAWPLDLHHYVEKHGVLLPSRFVKHIRSLNYIPPTHCNMIRQQVPWPSVYGAQKPGSRKRRQTSKQRPDADHPE